LIAYNEMSNNTKKTKLKILTWRNIRLLLDDTIILVATALRPQTQWLFGMLIVIASPTKQLSVDANSCNVNGVINVGFEHLANSAM